MKTKDIVSVVIRYAFFALFLFGVSGDITWIAGWVCFGLLVIYGMIALVMAAKHNPGVIEERMLREELDGYIEYTERVHYRLIPGVW